MGELLKILVGGLPEMFAYGVQAPLYVSLPIILLLAAFAYWRPLYGFGFFVVFVVVGLLSALATKGVSLIIWVPLFPFVTCGIAIGIILRSIRRAFA